MLGWLALAAVAAAARKPPTKPDALFKDGLMSRMVAATKNIKLETSQRVAAEQQFVASLTSYTEALQSGLRMVNKSVAGGSVPPARIVR